MTYKLKMPKYLMIFDLFILTIIIMSVYKAASAKDYKIFALMVPVFLVVIMLTIIWPFLTKVIVSENGLKLSIPPYSNKNILFSDITEIALVNLKELDDEKPQFKLFGTGLWKYNTGWYLLKNRLKVLLMIDKDNVIIVKTPKDVIYMSPENMEELYQIIEKNTKRSESNGV